MFDHPWILIEQSCLAWIMAFFIVGRLFCQVLKIIFIYLVCVLVSLSSLLESTAVCWKSEFSNYQWFSYAIQILLLDQWRNRIGYKVDQFLVSSLNGNLCTLNIGLTAVSL